MTNTREAVELRERLLKLRTALNTNAGLSTPATIHEFQVTLDKLEALAFAQTRDEPTEAMLDAAEAAYDREPPAIDAHRRGLAKAYLAMRSQQSGDAK